MRLFKQMIQTLFVSLVWIKYLCRTDTNTMYQDVHSDMMNQERIPKSLFEALKICKIQDRRPQYSIDDLIEALKQKVEMGANPHEGDLIDLIIEIFKIPFGPNVLTGKGIEKLKKAILLPGEMASFAEHIRKQQKSCFGCGKEFSNDESVVITHSDGSDRLFCLRCINPTVTPCPNCHKTIPFSERFTTKKIKDCPAHGGDIKKKEKGLDDLFRERLQVAQANRIQVDLLPASYIREEWVHLNNADPLDVDRANQLRFNPGPGQAEYYFRDAGLINQAAPPVVQDIHIEDPPRYAGPNEDDEDERNLF